MLVVSITNGRLVDANPMRLVDTRLVRIGGESRASEVSFLFRKDGVLVTIHEGDRVTHRPRIANEWITFDAVVSLRDQLSEAIERFVDGR